MLHSRISLVVGLATLVLGHATAQAQSAADRFVSFDQFIQNVAAATPAQYVGAAQSSVASASAFEDMRGHIIRLYSGLNVRHSYVLEGQTFDCIPVAQQPSAHGGPIAAPPPSGAAGDAIVFAPGKDKFGNTMPCEAGTIPMRRVTLQEISRFRTLREFFQKGPNGAGQAPNHASARAVQAHKYAHAYQFVNNFGGISTIGLWRPQINLSKTQVFSLSQHWYVSSPSGVTQTAEIGWQNFPQKYGSQNSALFIYYTADGYKQTGCYNLDCAAFIQVDNGVHLGLGFNKYSVKNGVHQNITLGFRFFSGNWWMSFGSTYVGYYRGALYLNKGMAFGAQEIDYGGETVGTTSFPPMGSGSFPAGGMKVAAAQSSIKYFTNNAGAMKVATLTAAQPSPACYKIILHNNSTSTMKTYFLYGGPGGKTC